MKTLNFNHFMSKNCLVGEYLPKEQILSNTSYEITIFMELAISTILAFFQSKVFNDEISVNYTPYYINRDMEHNYFQISLVKKQYPYNAS